MKRDLISLADLGATSARELGETSRLLTAEAALVGATEGRVARA